MLSLYILLILVGHLIQISFSIHRDHLKFHADPSGNSTVSCPLKIFFNGLLFRHYQVVGFVLIVCVCVCVCVCLLIFQFFPLSVSLLQVSVRSCPGGCPVGLASGAVPTL